MIVMIIILIMIMIIINHHHSSHYFSALHLYFKVMNEAKAMISRVDYLAKMRRFAEIYFKLAKYLDPTSRYKVMAGQKLLWLGNNISLLSRIVIVEDDMNPIQD
jgi:hypothetical protein